MRGNPMFNPASWLPRRPQQSRRSWVPARGRDAIEDVFSYHEEAQQVVEMDPNEFLRLTVPPGKSYDWLGDEHDRWGNEHNNSQLEQRMERDQAIDPAFLRVDTTDGRVLGHEGRHRAYVASRLGIDRIPVVLFLHTGHAYVDRVAHPDARVDPSRLKPQYEIHQVHGWWWSDIRRRRR